MKLKKVVGGWGETGHHSSANDLFKGKHCETREGRPTQEMQYLCPQGKRRKGGRSPKDRRGPTGGKNTDKNRETEKKWEKKKARVISKKKGKRRATAS